MDRETLKVLEEIHGLTVTQQAINKAVHAQLQLIVNDIQDLKYKLVQLEEQLIGTPRKRGGK